MASIQTPQIILASTSPRRLELLGQIGVACRVLKIEVDETPMDGELARDYVVRVAADKSAQGLSLSSGDLPVLAADTEVVLDGVILGKPRDLAHARALLESLSGREHQVLSAVSLRFKDSHWQALSESRVTFRNISSEEIAAYWQSGEPQDKAGGYAIQGLAAVFIAHLSGSFSGVMGLPLFETAELLQHAGIKVIKP